MTTAINPAVRIGHVHLTVSNLERALRFYRDALGFEIIWAGQPMSHPAMYSELKVKKRLLNFQEPEYPLNEPWWVTVMGCVMLAAIFAFALVAV